MTGATGGQVATTRSHRSWRRSIHRSHSTARPSSPTQFLLVARRCAERGAEAECRRYTSKAFAVARRNNSEAVAAETAWILGLLELGLNRIPAAVEAFARCAELQATVTPRECTRIDPAADRVEALLAIGEHVQATHVSRQAQRAADRDPTPRLLATAARCQALVAGPEFERTFETVLAGHQRALSGFERGRIELVFGERLYRAGKPREARRHLSAALATFNPLLAAPWAARAQRGLDASAETVRRRDPRTADWLTPREQQVAQIIGGGVSVKEAATRLFVADKTIEAHLARVYRKLDVHNRAQLVNALVSQGPRDPDPSLLGLIGGGH